MHLSIMIHCSKWATFLTAALHSVSVRSLSLPTRNSDLGPGTFVLPVQRRPLDEPSAGADFVEASLFVYAYGGQDRQGFFIRVDTGSCDTWLAKSAFDPSRSGHELDGNPYNTGYTGGARVSLGEWKDRLCVSTACVDDFAMGFASDAPFGLVGSGSGILALAPGDCSVTREPTFLDLLTPSLDQPVFAIDLNRQNGQIYFGGYDSSKYQGDLQTVQSPNDVSWDLAGLQVSTSDGNYLGSVDHVTIDTGAGAAGISLTEDIVRNYYSSVPNAQDRNGDGTSWYVPCDTTLPDLQIEVDGKTITVYGEELFYGYGRNERLNDGDNCPVYLSSFGVDLLGPSFLVSNFVVFNQADRTISWAPRTEEPSW